MGLKPGGTPKEYMTGVFVSQRTIISVEDVTSEAAFPCDVALKLTFEPVTTKTGKTFSPSMIIYGDFAKDDRGVVTGWGSAFKIDRLINHIAGWNQELESTTIPKEALDKCVGAKLYGLQYVSGYQKNNSDKVAYKDYQIVAAFEEYDGGKKMVVNGGDWLLDHFRNQVAQGRVTNFTPEILEKSNATDFSFDATGKAVGGEL